MTAPIAVTRLTEAQRAALRWFKEHNGNGLFDTSGVLVAAGERAPVMRSTWNLLSVAGFVEFYCDGKRLRAVEK
jgi:hypothetical protein